MRMNGRKRNPQSATCVLGLSLESGLHTNSLYWVGVICQALSSLEVITKPVFAASPWERCCGGPHSRREDVGPDQAVDWSRGHTAESRQGCIIRGRRAMLWPSHHPASSAVSSVWPWTTRFLALRLTLSTAWSSGWQGLHVFFYLYLFTTPSARQCKGRLKKACFSILGKDSTSPHCWAFPDHHKSRTFPLGCHSNPLTSIAHCPCPLVIQPKLFKVTNGKRGIAKMLSWGTPFPHPPPRGPLFVMSRFGQDDTESYL